MTLTKTQIHQLIYGKSIINSTNKYLGSGKGKGYRLINGSLVLHNQNRKKNRQEKILLIENVYSPFELFDCVNEKNITGFLIKKNISVPSHFEILAQNSGKGFILCSEKLISDLKKYIGKNLSANLFTGKIYTNKISLEKNQSNYNKLITQLVNLNTKNKMKVYGNADNYLDILNSEKYGAVGIGTIRTEHMFNSLERELIKNSILKDKFDKKISSLFLDKFNLIYKALKQDNKLEKICIRLIDPPMNEYSNGEVKYSKFIRGLRYYFFAQDLYNFQLKALKTVFNNESLLNKMIIKIPFVTSLNEVRIFMNENKRDLVNFRLGLTLETPSLGWEIITTKELSNKIELVDFGTNDLTQYFYATDRDDVFNFINYYDKVFGTNPFFEITPQLLTFMEKIVVNLKKIRKNIQVGICGKQQLDPKTVKKLNLDFVSVPPESIPFTIYNMSNIKNN